MILVAASVKRYLFNTLFQRALGYQSANQSGNFRFFLTGEFGLNISVQAAGRNQSMPCRIVNNLNMNVLQTSENAKSRPNGRAD